jgi:hypothetical protein
MSREKRGELAKLPIASNTLFLNLASSQNAPSMSSRLISTCIVSIQSYLVEIGELTFGVLRSFVELVYMLSARKTRNATKCSPMTDDAITCGRAGIEQRVIGTSHGKSQS